MDSSIFQTQSFVNGQLYENKYYTLSIDRLNCDYQHISTYGWAASKRDHGGLLFIDLRYKLSRLQCVISQETDQHLFAQCEKISLESVVRISGQLRKRPTEMIKDEPNGDVELVIERIDVLSAAIALPFQLDQLNLPEDLRLKYRFLDLRRRSMQRKIRMRADVIKLIRECMESLDFIEIQTPILTSTSPEGARDYVVPSRVHPGEFYALPQAPQQFKQLLIASGFERYYQIAPCFRDEDPRADRLLGAFYQLDMEMSFATQEDVFQVNEYVLREVFSKFTHMSASDIVFPRIKYRDAMNKYASDKPDLRNPLELIDIYNDFTQNTPRIFEKVVANKGKISMICCPGLSGKTRKFFDEIDQFGKSLGLPGVGYIIKDNDAFRGTLANILPDSVKNRLTNSDMDGAFIVAHDDIKVFYRAACALRNKLGNDLHLINHEDYKFCWIIDFPMYELDDNNKWEFAHNPFSMPQGGMDALLNQKPSDIAAYQYDIVCNGCELSSGAVRNHEPDLMYKAFEIAGYTKDDVDSKFGAMISAFRYGVPPHAGCAPGIERIVMLLTREANVREVIAFPLNQNGRDVMMNSPSPLDESRLKELWIKLDQAAIDKR